MKNNKVSSFDWRFNFGCFFLILSLLLLIIALILISSSNFITRYDNLGNGFWALNNYGIRSLLFNWVELDDAAIIAFYSSHPFSQIFGALLLLLFIFPLLFIIGCFLLLRWWIKTII